jgi:hypothetical protein
VVFQGHTVVSLLGTLILTGGFIIPVMLQRMGLMPRIGRGMKIWDYLLVYFYCLWIPNTTYAFFEIRHLILVDRIAEILTPWSFVVFGGISLIGLLTTIWGIRAVVNYYAKSDKERIIYTLLLSLICSFGGVVGILQYTSLSAFFFPPILIGIGLNLIANPILIAVALVTAVFLFGINRLLDRSSKLILKPT